VLIRRVWRVTLHRNDDRCRSGRIRLWHGGECTETGTAHMSHNLAAQYAPAQVRQLGHNRGNLSRLRERGVVQVLSWSLPPSESIGRMRVACQWKTTA
jgi:hypothetical protein